MAIKINPKNRGKFNALKKRTGKTTEELTHSKNPLTRKRAVFALNAKRWKKEDGGPIGTEPTGSTKKVGAAYSVVSGNVLHPLTDLNIVDEIIKRGWGTNRDSIMRLTPEQRQSMIPSGSDISFEKVKRGTANQGEYKYYQSIPKVTGRTLQLNNRVIDNPTSDVLKEYGYRYGGNLPKYGGLVTKSNPTGSSMFTRLDTIETIPGINSNNLVGGIEGVGTLGSGFIDAFANPDEITNNTVNVNEGAMAGKGALSGAATGASIGSIIPGIGTLIGAGVGALAGGISGFFGGRNKERRMQRDLNDKLTKQQFNRDVNSRMSRLQSNQSYMPVAKQGGFTIYKGETHKGPNGGILTDEQGNPTGLSNNPAIALTEKNEVARYNPDDKSTYIYSDNLGFAKPARDLINKYKLNKSNSLYKYDPMLKVAVDKQFDNLQQAQEFAKETKTSSKDTLGIFKNGGNLTSDKAKEILKDGIVRGHPLTARQKRYMGWKAGGSKEFGGELPILGDGTPTGDRIKQELRNLFGIGYTPSDIPWDRNIQDPTMRMYTESLGIIPSIESPYSGYSDNKTILDIPKGQVLREPTVTKPNNKIITTASIPTLRKKGLPEYNISKVPFKQLLPNTTIEGLRKSNISLPQNNIVEEQYNPTLSPLGHILSSVGNLADYNALRKAKPIPLSLPRVGAERISLARQRLANERNASIARSTNISNIRGSGINPGSSMANMATANTGVNRLLGQQNAESLMNEENTNAQFRQQANMANTELAMQEGMFNTQQLNAYRMARARLNPLGNLTKTAASYFKDNAAYGQGYDTLHMLAPDSEVYRPENQGFLDWLVGQQPGVRFRDRSLK
jgi:hypothetical protein